MTYLDERVKLLQLDDGDITVSYPRYEGAYGVGTPIVVHEKVLSEDEHGNICIHYHRPLGNIYTFKKSYQGKENKWPTAFIRKRFVVPKIGADGKEYRYESPKGSGMFPFFTPKLIEAYLTKTKIDVLFITEGEFKALKSCKHKMHVLGIPSIHGFYDNDFDKRVHEDIIDFVKVCQVEKLVLLTDADTLTVKWERDKDLSRRQELFYSAVKNFRESLQDKIDDEQYPLKYVYFMNIKEAYEETGKGLDDLMTSNPADISAIVKDAYELNFASKYFDGINITDWQPPKIRRYFGLTNEEDFYTTYKKFIGNREFGFKGRRYQYNGETVEYLRHEDTDKYMRIGIDWLKLITTPSPYGPKRSIVRWRIGEIQRDYAKYKDFVGNIPKYDAFCIEPGWGEDYKRVHNGCYNLYEPLEYLPKAGEFPNIAKFIKHIFEGEGDFGTDIENDLFTVALDWLTILHQHPKQSLPMLLLVSEENRTGKTTFLKLLNHIYGSNACILNNEQFKMKFNAHYITKFIIGIDEGYLDVDKRAEKERLKQLLTSNTQMLENKGMDLKDIPFYGKIILSSNEADNVMKMDDMDTRWFVVKVRQLKEEDLDHRLEENMMKEIPQYLHYIQERKIFHPNEDRLWFKPHRFITEQFRRVVEETKGTLDKSIHEWVLEQFYMYLCNRLVFTAVDIVKGINTDAKYKFQKYELLRFLKKKKNLKSSEIQRRYVPNGSNVAENGDLIPKFKKEPVKGFILKIEDWLNDDEIAEIKEFAQQNFTEFNDHVTEIINTKLPF